MAYKVIILYQLYMPSYFLGTFTEYPYLISVSNRDTNKSRVPNSFWTPSNIIKLFVDNFNFVDDQLASSCSAELVSIFTRGENNRKTIFFGRIILLFVVQG